MILIALSLGFFGSLHCVGMCGPLAVMGCHHESRSNMQTALMYNVGRISTYAVLGITFGLLGQLLYIASLQKAAAIISGIVLIIAFLLSINIDAKIGQSGVGLWINKKVQFLFSKLTGQHSLKSTFMFGLLNGLLPCGLVYLALAGALACESIAMSTTFMVAFGLGTLPAMMGAISGYKLLGMRGRKVIHKILPTVSLFVGLFLVYRGVYIDVPLELNFWEAMQQPIMCH